MCCGGSKRPVLPPAVSLRVIKIMSPECEKKRVCELVEKLLYEIHRHLDDRRSSSYISSTEEPFRTNFKFEKLTQNCLGLADLRIEVAAVQNKIHQRGQQLARAVRRRDQLLIQHSGYCDLITAYIQAFSKKTKEEAKMRFSLTPGETGFSQWLDAMKMVAQLPGGMPPEFRTKLWLQLSEKHLQDKKIDWPRTEKIIFSEWSNPDDEELGVQIVKDLHRTGCSLFCGAQGEQNQALLKRVLLAYARWNKSVGYCQGFNMLGAIILQVMDRDEKNAVKVMIYLIDGVLPESYFANNLRGLSVDMAVFRDLMKLRLPKLSRHLEALQQDTSSGSNYEPPLTNVFTMQWFLTLFSNCLPQATVLRVWDLVFLHGNEVLLRTALAIWGILQDRVISVESADEFYCIMGVVTREMLEFGLMDANNLVKTIAMVDPFPNELQELRDKYLYNISPWTQSVQSAAKRGFRLFHSDNEDQDDTEDEATVKALAAAHGVFRRRESVSRDVAHAGPTLDIGVLKQQYAKLLQRQRQAHVIISAACSGTVGSPSVAVNHLLAGKSALVAKTRRIGPPEGAVPPPVVHHKPGKKLGKSGETLQWKDAPKADTATNEPRKNLDRVTETSVEESFRRKEQKQRTSSSSSSSTELCDDEFNKSDLDSEETSESSSRYDKEAFDSRKLTASGEFDQQFSDSIRDVETLTQNIAREEEGDMESIRLCALDVVDDIEQRLETAMRLRNSFPVERDVKAIIKSEKSPLDDEPLPFYTQIMPLTVVNREILTQHENVEQDCLSVDATESLISQENKILFKSIEEVEGKEEKQISAIESDTGLELIETEKEIQDSVDEITRLKTRLTEMSNNKKVLKIEDSTEITSSPELGSCCETKPIFENKASPTVSTITVTSSSRVSCTNSEIEGRTGGVENFGTDSLVPNRILRNDETPNSVKAEREPSPENEPELVLEKINNSESMDSSEKLLLVGKTESLDKLEETYEPISVKKRIDFSLSTEKNVSKSRTEIHEEVGREPRMKGNLLDENVKMDPTRENKHVPEKFVQSPRGEINGEIEKTRHQKIGNSKQPVPALEIKPDPQKLHEDVILQKPQVKMNPDINKPTEEVIGNSIKEPGSESVLDNVSFKQKTETKPQFQQFPQEVVFKDSSIRKLSPGVENPREELIDNSMKELKHAPANKIESIESTPRTGKRPDPEQLREEVVKNSRIEISLNIEKGNQPRTEINPRSEPIEGNKPVQTKIEAYPEPEIKHIHNSKITVNDSLEDLLQNTTVRKKIHLEPEIKTIPQSISNRAVQDAKTNLDFGRKIPKSLVEKEPEIIRKQIDRNRKKTDLAVNDWKHPKKYNIDVVYENLPNQIAEAPTDLVKKNDIAEKLALSKNEWETKMKRIAELDSATRAKISELNRRDSSSSRYRGRSISPSLSRPTPSVGVERKKLKVSTLSFDEITSRTEKLLRDSGCSDKSTVCEEKSPVSNRDFNKTPSPKKYFTPLETSPTYVRAKDSTSKFKKLIEESYGPSEDDWLTFPKKFQAFSSPTSPEPRFRNKIKYSEFVSPRKLNYKPKDPSWAIDDDEFITVTSYGSKLEIKSLESKQNFLTFDDEVESRSGKSSPRNDYKLADRLSPKLGYTVLEQKSTNSSPDRKRWDLKNSPEDFPTRRKTSPIDSDWLKKNNTYSTEDLSRLSSPRRSYGFSSPEHVSSSRKIYSPDVSPSYVRQNSSSFCPFPPRSPQRPKDIAVKLGLYPSGEISSKNS